MATSKQEQTYNEIIKYYDYTEKLIEIAENSSRELSDDQFAIIEEAIEKFEKSADYLSNKYIEYVKNGEKQELIEATRLSLNDISAKIEECRNKILMLYNEKNK